MLSKSVLFLAAASSVAAQQPAYAQCGGKSWTGATTCASGYSCVASGDWYSQCLPAAVSKPAKSVTTAKGTSTKKPISTSTVNPSTTASSTTTSASGTSPSSTQSAATGLKRIISFGDSYSQTGFLANETLPSASNPIGNPAFPGYTTSGGKNWLGNLVEVYNTTLTYDYNFASGGATTDSNLIVPYASTVLSLVQQVAQFQQYLGSKPASAPWTSTDSLFAIWIGVNDVGNGWYQSNWPTLLQEVIAQYFNQTQILYNTGARKFLFLSVPPIYLTPNVIAQGASTQASEQAAIAQYNSALTTAASSFAANNTGVEYWVLNTTDSFLTPINNPTAYGAANATCFDSDGTTCLWWNDYHPALAIQNLVGKAAAALIGDW